MRILFCIPTLGRGGAERQLSYLAPELVRLGDEVHVACLRGGAFRDGLAAAGVTLHEGGSLLRLMLKLKPDVVQTCLTRMDIVGGIAALLTRTPWVLREPSAPEAYASGWKNRLRRLLARRADAIVANSRQSGAPYVVRNGVPLAEIDAIATQRSGRNAVLFAGRMDAAKNPATLVAALQQLDVDYTAVFCGDGPCRPELERMAAGRVAFPGVVDDLWQRMKAADVVVSLSRCEGSPNVILEAMAAGCPLVVSDIAAHREILDDASALFVPADDAAAAARAIRETLTSPEEAAKRARAARARVEEMSVERMGREFREVYERIRRRG